ncbi:fimbrial protein [Serratia marcescens]|uniref:fimbrial protein n=1 Tax=Serratia marcescens TaxID=615 RepID=UPI000667E7AA
MKSIFKLAALSLAVIGGVNMAHASPSTTVTVSGSVSAVTCDLGVDANKIDLGVASPADFDSGAGKLHIQTQQAFSVLTSHCAGVPIATTGQAAIKITAPTTSSGTQYFADGPSPDFAIGLYTGTDPTKLIHNNDLVQIVKAGAPLADINNVSTQFHVGLLNASVGKPKPGSVTAPITFTFVYN